MQILRVAAEAAGRFSPHETLFIMRDAVFSWASEALELELGSSRTVLLKVFMKALTTSTVFLGAVTRSDKLLLNGLFCWYSEFVDL